MGDELQIGDPIKFWEHGFKQVRSGTVEGIERYGNGEVMFYAVREARTAAYRAISPTRVLAPSE